MGTWPHSADLADRLLEHTDAGELSPHDLLRPLSGGDSTGLIEFGLSLGRSGRRLLMLDYDGTLAPFRIERNEAVPYEGIREVLGRIIGSGDRVVIISGRLASEVANLIDLHPTPEIWGCHGWERLTGGKLTRLPLPRAIVEKLFRVGYTLKNEGFQSRLEFKHGSIALHWRGALAAERSAVLVAGLRAMEPAEGSGLRLHRFDGGLELRATGRNKGVVVREILASHDRSGPSAYLGDDLTDEDAFRALKGYGMAILVRPEPRETSASVWLKPPEELLKFLELWAGNSTPTP